MKPIEEKTLRILEYPKVLEQLSQYALSEKAMRQIMQLTPLQDLDAISRLQQETADALKILRSVGGVPLATLPDLTPIFKRMNIQADLDGAEIAAMGKLLALAREVTTFFERLAERELELSCLYEVAGQLIPLKKLENKIKQSVSESGRVYDDASPKLSNIRENIQRTERGIRSQLEKITQGKQAKYLSDTLITMRNNRYVIPVKANYRSRFGGVVHDQSASGQTLFIEPQRVLELNNHLKQLQSEEHHEVQRVLAELTTYIAPYLDELMANEKLLTQLDVLQAKARYARNLKATQPQLATQEKIALYKARHPLIPAEEVVANDITLGDDFQQVIVTGPNTGGKTVVLKTLGLLQLMAQTGLHIPAEDGSSVGIYDHILADIGDEQSIEQSLSTFSSHMTSIVSIMRLANKKSLVLFDELGAGTDPQEGAALAMAILDTLMARGADVMTTSHYPELKAYGYNRPHTANASMEFDVDTLQPTYRFLMGIPGKSNALEIAGRLGLNPEILATAKRGISHESQGIDEMINDLNRRQKELTQDQQTTHKYLVEAEGLHRELKKVHDQYLAAETEREKLAKARANDIVAQAEQKAERILDEIRQLQLEAETHTVKEHEMIDAKGKLAKLRHEEDHLQHNKVLKKAKRAKAIKVGQTVYVERLHQQGTVVEKTGNKEWMVQLGMMKVKLPASDLTPIKDSETPQTSGTKVQAHTASTSSELDVRGERVEEAVYHLENYIDQALLANLSQVTIIHGMGTGVVRQAVQERLCTHPRVATYHDAPANQGGNGATIVKLK